MQLEVGHLGRGRVRVLSSFHRASSSVVPSRSRRHAALGRHAVGYPDAALVQPAVRLQCIRRHLPTAASTRQPGGSCLCCTLVVCSQAPTLSLDSLSSASSRKLNLGGGYASGQYPGSAQPVTASLRPPRATHRPAAARAPRTYDARVHLRPRLGPANSLSAARVRGRRAMAENRAVLPPDDGQAAADDARPRKLGRAGRDRERTPCRAQQKRAEGSVGRRQVVWC